ncbi:hypothetical protein [Acinetobacter pittii]|uniref:hypothetical protein n=1 Tax=Acinetobacter pittii TaxID=48296 RepID=UPI000837B093|nr:hypothetical protein [Acinetobacter pittii]MCU4428526.1 hypothetical protein [Acinetobacter pittii]OCZ47336.1 hypothetical protein BFR73_10395 [Acinetobacter pittii]
MDDKKERLSNNLRTIILIIIALSYAVFKILSHFEIALPASVVNITFGIAIPLGVMGMNLSALWSVKKTKDINTPERRRLIYFANIKAKRLINCIALYVIVAIMILVSSSFPYVNEHIKYILPIVIGTLGASIYSALIAYRDMIKISDFEALLQGRANQAAARVKFQSKSKS